MTIGERYNPAMEVIDQAAADAYFENLLQYMMSRGRSREDAERIERINIGHYAGYFSDDTRKRVYRLFRCDHPIFGSIGGAA